MSGERLRSPLSGATVVVALVFLYVPLVVVVLFSLNSSSSLTLPFGGFSVRWYREILQSPEFGSSVRNSAIVALVVAVTTFVLGTAAAWGLSRLPPRSRAPISLLLFLPLTIPGLFLGLSLLVLFGRAQLTLSLTTVVIAHLVYVLPYFLLIAVATLSRLDPALEEAGADLGATPWQAFSKVTFPQVWPVLLGAAVLAFALSFDEFVITFFVIGPESTLPLYVFSSLRRTVDPSINAISTLLLLISLVMFAVAALLTLRRPRGGPVPLDGDKGDALGAVGSTVGGDRP